MTSTSSAAATGLPDRRHFLSTLAGAGALRLPTLPALAGSPGPVEAMWPELLRLESAHGDAALQLTEAEERYEEPEKARWHPFSEEGGYLTIRTSLGRGVAVLDHGPENIAYLKDAIAREHRPDDPDCGCSNKHRADGARKTLAKIEAWHAEVKRRKDAAGMTKADEVYQAASSAACAHRTNMLAIEATTFRELAFQAILFEDDWRQRDAERVLARLAELAGVTSHDQW